MPRTPSQPCALTIAGSDSGGGAGIQADLRVWNALGVHGVTAITCLTAQNPRAVTAVHAAPPAFLRRQLEAVAVDFAPGAVKTGMLYSTALVRTVVEFLESWGAGRPPLVVDPVMVATSGARLLQPSTVRLLERRLLPRAQLVTPNLDEARILTGVEAREPEDLRRAARILRDRFGCAALIKGGHLRGSTAIDVYWDGTEELLLESARVRGVSTHGTGCTYSAAVAGFLARGSSLPDSVRRSKQVITEALVGSRRVAGHWVLGAPRNG